LHLFKVERTWSASNNYFPIVFLGDMHIGNPACDYKLLKKHIEDIEKLPNAMVFLMGDMAEWIVCGDKRYQASQIDPQFRDRLDELPMAYLDYLEDLLAPIAHKIEVLHDGTHEKKMFPLMYPGAELASRLRKKAAKRIGNKEAQNKLRYAPGEAYTKITWKTKTNSDYRSTMINTAHGWQAGRQPGAKHNTMQSLFAWIGADMVFRGHSHELFAEYGSPREVPNQQMSKIHTVDTICGNTGSYFTTREVSKRPSYAEDAGYKPLRKGHIQVHVQIHDDGLTKTIHVK